MSRDGCVALPRGAMGLSAICDYGIPDQTYLLFLYIYLGQNTFPYFSQIIVVHVHVNALL